VTDSPHLLLQMRRDPTHCSQHDLLLLKHAWSPMGSSNKTSDVVWQSRNRSYSRRALHRERILICWQCHQSGAEKSGVRALRTTPKMLNYCEIPLLFLLQNNYYRYCISREPVSRLAAFSYHPYFLNFIVARIKHCIYISFFVLWVGSFFIKGLISSCVVPILHRIITCGCGKQILEGR
jgi:hypothetical protein